MIKSELFKSLKSFEYENLYKISYFYSSFNLYFSISFFNQFSVNFLDSDNFSFFNFAYIR